MPLIDSRLKPGQWTQDRQGASGAHYVLRFQGNRFLALSRRDRWTGIGEPWYWRRVYTAYENNRHPHGKMVLSAFEDLGIVGKLAVAKFVNGRHIYLTRATLDDSDDSSELISGDEGDTIMAETVTVTEADLVEAIKDVSDNRPEGAEDTVESFGHFIFAKLRAAAAPAGEIGVGGPDSGVIDDDNIDDTAANNG